MMIVQNYVAPSKIHGVGLFAGENIENNQIIYVLNSQVDIVIDVKKIEAIGHEFARFMRMYAFTEVNTKEVIISLDNSRFMKPSECPNTLSDLLTAGRHGIYEKVKS